MPLKPIIKLVREQCEYLEKRLARGSEEGHHTATVEPVQEHKTEVVKKGEDDPIVQTNDPAAPELAHHVP